MFDKVNVFTKGFNNNTDPLYPLLPTSLNYFEKFDGRGYYIFVENRISHNCYLAGEFNGSDLIFHSISNGNLFQAEITRECIQTGENIYQIVLTDKNDSALSPEIIKGSLIV